MSTVIALSEIRARRSYAARAAEEASADAAAREVAVNALRALLAGLAPLEARVPGAIGVGLNELLHGAMVARIAEGYDAPDELAEHVDGIARSVAADAWAATQD
jgi:hypothetical protein